MIFIKKNWLRVSVITYTVLLPIVSLAQAGPPLNPSEGKIINPIPSITSIPGLIETLLTGALKVGIPVVALAIVYCGFLFVFARGNSEKLTHARQSLMYTLIGAAILLGSWAIAKMISATVLAL